MDIDHLQAGTVWYHSNTKVDLLLTSFEDCEVMLAIELLVVVREIYMSWCRESMWKLDMASNFTMA